MFFSELIRSHVSKRLALFGGVGLGVVVLGSNAAWAQTGPFLYVPHDGSNSVSVIDTSTNVAGTAVTVGTNPLAVGVSGDESFVYVTNWTDNTVSAINTATNTVVATIAVGTAPRGVAVTPDGTTVYVANNGSDSVSVINTATNTVVNTIAVGATPRGVAVTPDGKTVYVVDFGSNTVTPINTATNTAGAPIAVGPQPVGVAVTPDGKTVYVANQGSSTVTPINTATNTAGTPIVVGASPSGLAVTPDGKTVYVANFDSNTVSVINTATNTVVTTITVGSLPVGVAVSPDGKTVYVTNQGVKSPITFNNTVTVINTATNTVVTTITVGSDPIDFPGICSNGNALLASGLTFKANSPGALACTLASGPTGSPGPIFTGGTLQLAGGSMTINLPVSVQSAGGTIDTLGTSVTLANTLSGPGALTVKGNLVFTTAAVWMLSINGTQSSTVTVTGGSATLNGASVSVASGSTVVPGNKYTILTATGGVSGTFNPTVVYNGEIGTLTYNADDVFLTFGTDPPPLMLPAGAPTNVVNVANAINTFNSSGGTFPTSFQNLFSLSSSQLVTALTQLDGEAATDAEKGAFALMNQFLGLMLDPFVDGRFAASGQAIGFAPETQASFPPDIALAYASVFKAPPLSTPSGTTFSQRWTSWGAGFGAASTTSGNAAVGSNTVTVGDYGFAGGMDYHVTPDTVYGFALAGGGTNWNLAQGLGGGRSDTFQAGLYSATRYGPAYLAAALAFSNNWITTNRTTLGDDLIAHFGGQGYGARVETGYRYNMPLDHTFVGIAPYAALQTQWFHTPSYSETDLASGGFGLTYNAMTANDTRGELGARFDDPTLIGNMPLILRARLAWAHDWVSNPSLGAVFQSLPGASFVVNGATPPKDSALASAGARLYLTSALSFIAKFDGEFANGSQTYGGTGTLRYTW